MSPPVQLSAVAMVSPFSFRVWTTVSSRPVSVTGVSISPSSLNLSTKSGSRTLDYTITPNGAKPSSLYWESSNSSVVTVDGSGKVTPVGAGSADITLTTDNGTKGTCHVTVTAPAQSIALSDKTLTLAIDQGTYTLTWTFSPKGSGGELVWTSDNAGVAKVDQKGVITPVSVGETDIRVKTDQNVTAVCHVVVKGTAKDLFAAGMPEITTCKAAGDTVLLTWNKYENADSYIILRRKANSQRLLRSKTSPIQIQRFLRQLLIITVYRLFPPNGAVLLKAVMTKTSL